jgi:hypothetical protein
MHTQDESSLSAAFLRQQGSRLDAIGKWQLDPVEDGILWREPSALQNDWVPFDLRFTMEAGNSAPDEAMFALWERYRPLHQELVRQFRTEAQEIFEDDKEEPFGKRTITRACVWVRRTGEENDIFHVLEVTFNVPQDEDHGYYAEFVEQKGTFTGISCS